jgi:predicted regulator of Ras-like GTPase activity (Roadblock/LC7/MglB family)
MNRGTDKKVGLMNENAHSGADLNWLLDDLVERVVGAQHAVVLSADGLLIGKSAALSKDDSDQLSAMASAFQSLARGTGKHFGGGNVRQTIVEMEHAYLFVTAAGRGACLAVLAEELADMGMIAYEMNLLVKRVGVYLSSAPRTNQAAGFDSGHMV